MTPALVREAAIASLQKGKTFYAHNLSTPGLREAIAASSDGLRPAGAAVQRAEHIAVISGGVNALMLAAQALLECDDEVVAVTLVWPNLTAQPAIKGVRGICVSLRPQGGQWQLDMGKLEFNTSCASAFVQRAKLTAMEHTGDVTPQLISHFKLCGDALVPLLQTLPGVQLALPKGGMCAFFRLQDQDRFGDSLAMPSWCCRLPRRAAGCDGVSPARTWTAWCRVLGGCNAGLGYNPRLCAMPPCQGSLAGTRCKRLFVGFTLRLTAFIASAPRCKKESHDCKINQGRNRPG